MVDFISYIMSIVKNSIGIRKKNKHALAYGFVSGFSWGWVLWDLVIWITHHAESLLRVELIGLVIIYLMVIELN